MTAMSELQYYSPGKQIYYWFGDAFGVTGKTDGPLLYLGTKGQVLDALFNNKLSVNLVKNHILENERNAAPDYYQNKANLKPLQDILGNI